MATTISAPHLGKKPESSAPIDRPGLQHIGELLPAVLQAIAEQADKCTHYEDRGLRRAA